MNFINVDASHYYYTFLKILLSLDLTACNEPECFFIIKSQFLKKKGVANVSLFTKLSMKQGAC